MHNFLQVTTQNQRRYNPSQINPRWYLSHPPTAYMWAEYNQLCWASGAKL